MQELEKESNFKIMKYFEELKKSMNYLAENKKTIFIGQAVEVPGTAMSNTLEDIKLGILESPKEDMQQSQTVNPTSINTLIVLHTQLKPSPNPFLSSTTIDFPNYKKEPFTLQIYNENGIQVRKEEDITAAKVVVEKGNLYEGEYFVELRSVDKIFLSKLVIE